MVAKKKKYWFGRKISRHIMGFFVPLTVEGWIFSVIFILYLVSLGWFMEFYLDHWLVWIISFPFFVLTYYLVGSKKQDPKFKDDF